MISKEWRDADFGPRSRIRGLPSLQCLGQPCGKIRLGWQQQRHDKDAPAGCDYKFVEYSP
jgi:hypothetical protein